MTQAELAGRIGAHVPDLSRWERDLRPLSGERIYTISTEFRKELRNLGLGALDLAAIGREPRERRA